VSEPKPFNILVFLRRLRGDPKHVSEDVVLGQCERAALAAAMKLRDELHAQLTTVAVGPGNREERVLAMTLRAGCDRAVRVHDRKLGELDYLGVAQILAATAEHIGFDLILCGDRSEDELQGAVGPAVAGLLEVPHLSGLFDVRGEIDEQEERRTLLLRHRADGKFHSFRYTPPAVLCVAAFPRARHPHDGDDRRDSGAGRRTSVHGGTMERLGLDELGLDPRALSHRRRFLGRPRATREGCNATLFTNADDLVSRLVGDRLLG